MKLLHQDGMISGYFHRTSSRPFRRVRSGRRSSSSPRMGCLWTVFVNLLDPRCTPTRTQFHPGPRRSDNRLGTAKLWGRVVLNMLVLDVMRAFSHPVGARSSVAKHPAVL